ncbi:hypothetical protein, partial [Propionibacterium freudenreichii]
TSAARPSASATSATTSLGRCSKPADSDPRYTLVREEPNAVTSAVQAQQRRAIRAANPRRSFDRPEFGAALVCVGLALVTLARWRQRP